MSNFRNFKDYHIEQLRDPEDAKIYLSVALEDYEQNRDAKQGYRSVFTGGERCDTI